MHHFDTPSSPSFFWMKISSKEDYHPDTLTPTLFLYSAQLKEM